MSSDLPIQAQVDVWRQKALQGQLTDDELREAVKVIRAGRIAAAQLGATRKAKRGPTRSAEDLLSGFADLGDNDDDETGK